ncbi:MAG: polysaccharide deacetylase family protein [Methylomonas sp.]
MSSTIPALLYHQVGDEVGTTSEALFSAHLNWLTIQGYRSLSLAEFKQRLKHPDTKSNARREVLITFDDGYADIYDKVFPILKKFNFKATIFLITDKVGKERYLDWTSVLELQSSGLFEFQSHSHTHIRWPSEALVKEDLIESRMSLATYLNKPESDFDTLAWPWGACNKQWENLAIEAGFTTQFLVQTATVVVDRGSLRLPRTNCNAMPLWLFIGIMQSLSFNFHNVPLINWASYVYRRLRGGFGYL